VRFYDNMTGERLLNFMNGARGGGHESEFRRLAEVLSLDLSRRIRVYSRGMKQKLGLIQAFMHRPKVLVLDEPTTALDPLVRQVLFDELRAACADGRTVLFSSHTLSEVEELCDRVAILRRGKLVEEDSIDNLRERAIRHVRAVFEPGRAPRTAPPLALRLAQQVDGAFEGTWTGPTHSLVQWIASGVTRDATIAAPRLEDLFMTYYQSETPAGADRRDNGVEHADGAE
jgi:ABC-2 type transport system ATP-binding protein